jgi:biotin carboxylase
LAEELIRRGMNCVHIQSSRQVPEGFLRSFRNQDFRRCITHHGNLTETLAALSGFELRAILPGAETGVVLAHQLSTLLGLKRNNWTNEFVCRDKWLMAEALRSHSIPCPKSFNARHLDSLLIWIEKNQCWPVVLKPAASAGTDRVALCTSEQDVTAAFQLIVDNTNRLGADDQVVIAQQYLNGPEFIIDTVSHEGKHALAAAWKVTRGCHNGRPFICETTSLIPILEPLDWRLVQYTRRVLDALGIVIGPAHTEVRINDGEPRLLETAARLHGGGFPVHARPCIGFDQVILTVDAYVDPDRFHKIASQPYKLHEHLTIVELIAMNSGRLRSMPRLSDLSAKLSSFASFHTSLSPGDNVVKTVDVFSSPGYIVLRHSDPAQIARDCAVVRDWERNGLLELF